MSFFKDFLITTGIMSVGLEFLERKQNRDMDELYQIYADARGVSVNKAKRLLAEAEERQAEQQARQAAEKAQRMAETREAIRDAKGLLASIKVWAQAISREGQIAKLEAQSTHR